jgi:hypothetical protein
MKRIIILGLVLKKFFVHLFTKQKRDCLGEVFWALNGNFVTPFFVSASDEKFFVMCLVFCYTNFLNFQSSIFFKLDENSWFSNF